jgi:glycosyltransferase involved in cell wall biosynthesis
MTLKIALIIDHLGSGGAQRQIATLATLLASRGHSVRLITYFPHDHFLAGIQECGVVHELINRTTKLGRFRAIRRAVRRQRPDIIVGFLDSPNALALFAALPPRRIPVVVSERNCDFVGVNLRNQIRFNAFRAASVVVTNSYWQSEFIRTRFSFLTHKVHTIVNCVDPNRFCPVAREQMVDSQSLSLIVAASVIPRKNVHTLIQALHIVREKMGLDATVDWFGSRHAANGDSSYYEAMVRDVSEMGLNGAFRFRDSCKALETEYPKYDACCLPSFQEGCPNAICEAMACGLPAIVSDFGDNRILVEEGRRGFRFDPSNASDLADAIRKVADLSLDQRALMGRESRAYAVSALSPERFAGEYETLLTDML